MTTDEKRTIRREWINEWIHLNHSRVNDGGSPIPLYVAKKAIREYETINFGFELKVYANDNR